MMMRNNKRDWNIVSSQRAKIDISRGREPKSFSGQSMHHIQVKRHNGHCQQRVMQVNEDACYFSEPVDIEVEVYEDLFDTIRSVKKRSSDNAE
jgi:hypothetical protein